MYYNCQYTLELRLVKQQLLIDVQNGDKSCVTLILVDTAISPVSIPVVHVCHATCAYWHILYRYAHAHTSHCPLHNTRLSVMTNCTGRHHTPTFSVTILNDNYYYYYYYYLFFFFAQHLWSCTLCRFTKWHCWTNIPHGTNSVTLKNNCAATTCTYG